MTNEEVIVLMKDKLSNAAISREYSSDPIAANLCGKEVEMYTIALDAFEKAITYRWHDLRKNPEDLPPLYRSVIASDGNEEHECRYTPVYGWYFYEPKQIFDVRWENRLNYPVIAWKYIEPFEEEQL